MAAKKKKAPAKSKDQVRPSSLGTGGAANAASKIVQRRKATCEAGGGTWNSKALRCDW
jgi:hypothetical protein